MRARPRDRRETHPRLLAAREALHRHEGRVATQPKPAEARPGLEVADAEPLDEILGRCLVQVRREGLGVVLGDVGAAQERVPRYGARQRFELAQQ